MKSNFQSFVFVFQKSIKYFEMLTKWFVNLFLWQLTNAYFVWRYTKKDLHNLHFGSFKEKEERQEYV